MFRSKTITKRKRLASRDRSFAKQLLGGIVKIFIFAIFVVGIYYASRLQAFTIEHVAIEGGETVDLEALTIVVKDELKGTYFRLIPKSFTYTYPHERLIEVIKKNPRVHDVTITTPSRRELHIVLDEYVPEALWCVSESTSTPCYFLDTRGYAFAEAPILIGGSFVRHHKPHFVGDPIGQVTEEDTLEMINRFIIEAENVLGFRITSLTYLTDNDVSFSVNGGGTILVSLQKDVLLALENISATLATETFQHIEPGNFKYIDARFESKIFINEVLIPPEETTVTEPEEVPE